MSNKKNELLSKVKQTVESATSHIDFNEIVEKGKAVGVSIGEKASELKDSAMVLKEDIMEKLTELDRMLETSINEYNDAYTLMSDKGVQLFLERRRSVDTIMLIENLINSIANHPKSFDVNFEEINTNRDKFVDSCDFGKRELEAARDAVGGAGAGLAAGASVAFMAPTAAMWIATTFGTASTGTAISTLSGAAATNAALAWLGGGTLASGAGGVAGGSALLALAGPIGWGIAGASLLASILLFARKKSNLNKQKNQEIETVKRNTEKIKEIDAQLAEILDQTKSLREKLNSIYMDLLVLFGKDYTSFSQDQKESLGSLVNNTLSLSTLFEKTIQNDRD